MYYMCCTTTVYYSIPICQTHDGIQMSFSTTAGMFDRRQLYFRGRNYIIYCFLRGVGQACCIGYCVFPTSTGRGWRSHLHRF